MLRVTDRMLAAWSIESATRRTGQAARLQQQIATGARLRALSDAPLDGRSVLDIDAAVRAHEQYAKNIESARTRMAAEEAALTALGDVLARAREIAIQQGSATANADTRAAAASEISSLRDAVVQLANQRINEAYVFGGPYADRPPLDASGALDPSAPARGDSVVEIGVGTLASTVHDAGVVFIDSDAVGALGAVENALRANSAPAIQATVDRLRAASARVQALVAEVGARQVRLDLARTSQSRVLEGLEARRSDLADTDLAEAATRLAAQRSSYEAALVATTRLLQSSLVHYLR